MEPNKMEKAVAAGSTYRDEPALCGVILLDFAYPTSAVLAKCARGEHDPGYKYGVIGIMVGLLCCPCGFILTLYVNRIRGLSSGITQYHL